MSRKRIVAGNWKMNLDRESSITLALDVQAMEHSGAATDVVIFPATIWLAPVADALGGGRILLGGQNCHSEPKGAFTGEVSASMLAGVCSHAMAGHSERRHVFGESDQLVGAKVRAILANGMTAVLCVGETFQEREDDQADAVVERQLRIGLEHVAESDVDRLVVAYEPVWAIGTGVAATPADAQAMCRSARAVVGDVFGQMGTQISVLYGGSVTPDNAGELFGQADIDGGLVGGASLDVQSFRAIVNASESVGGT